MNPETDPALTVEAALLRHWLAGSTSSISEGRLTRDRFDWIPIVDFHDETLARL
jgi:hypothetical protein